MPQVPSRTSHLTATVALASMMACGGSTADTSSGAVVTDSAGIAIVTSMAPGSVIEPAHAWTIGGADQDNLLLDATGLAVRDDGTVLVANSGTAEVLAFDTTGALRWRFGRRGPGPGEFQRTLSLAAIGDTAYAYEFGLARLTAIGPDGTLQRTSQALLDGPNVELHGGFSDGSLLFTARYLVGMKPGLNTDSVTYQRLSIAGVPLGTLGWSRGSTVDFVMADMGPNLDEQAFGPTSAVATAGDWLARAGGRDAEVRLSDPTGRLRRIVRWSWTPVAVTEADREAYRAARLADTRSEAERQRVADWLAHATFADSLPPTGALAVARDGRLLVAERCGPGHDACDWRLFDAEGRWVRTLRLPVRAERAVVVGGLLVTLSEDADGVERLDAWRL